MAALNLATFLFCLFLLKNFVAFIKNEIRFNPVRYDLIGRGDVTAAVFTVAFI